MKSLAVIGFLFATVFSCSGGNSGSGKETIDREQLLAFYADQLIIPGYQAFAAATQALEVAASGFCADKSAANFESVRSAWKLALSRWAETEVYGFGPVMTGRYDSKVHFWPRRDEKIAEFMAAHPTIDKATVAAGGALTRGFHVMEYLLYEPAGAEARTAADFSDGASARCDYLHAVAQVLTDDGATLAATWPASGGNFREEFVRAGKGSPTFIKQAQAFDALVNALLTAMRNLEDMKIARPLGKRDGGAARPGDVETPRAAFSLTLVADNLLSGKALFAGDMNGEGVHPLSLAAAVGEVNADVPGAVLTQFDKARAAAAAIDLPLATAVIAKPTAVETLFEEVRVLVRLLSVDVAGALGVTPTFSDNDGD